MKKRLNVFAVSDGTGETVDRIINAVLLQYGGKNEARIFRYKGIRTEKQVSSVLEEASRSNAMVIYTIVTTSIRDSIEKGCTLMNIAHVDLFGSLMDLFNKHLGGRPNEKPGILHEVNEEYYKRIEAMEFTVKHDDGSDLENLERADIVLVGISRTSKTPLSIFLSHKGYKVANVPLVKGLPLPENLQKIDQRKIVGLTIKPEALVNIRRERVRRMGQDTETDYCTFEKVVEEVEWAQQIFDRNKRWPIFDVTNKALEETASDIENKIMRRYKLSDFEIEDN